MDENMDNTPSSERSMVFEHNDNAKRMRTDFNYKEESSSSAASLSSTASSTSSETTTSRSLDSTDPSANTSNDSGVPMVSSDTSSIDPQIYVPRELRRQSVSSGWESSPLERPNLRENSASGHSSDITTASSATWGSWDSTELYGGDTQRSSSSEFTVVHSTDTEESDEEAQVDEILTKSKPKNTFLMVPEFIQRQYGYGNRKSNPVLFQDRCYGSLMNVEKLELMYKLEDHDGCVNSLNFSPDGKVLASGSDDLTVVLWDWTVGKTLLKINTRHKRNIFQTKFLNLKGPDFHLATCGRDGQVWYLQIGSEGLRESRKLGQHRAPCHKLAVLKDQPHVFLSAGEDGIVFNYDVRRNKPEKVVHVKDDGSREVALFSINSHPLKTHEFCVAGRENSVRVYDARKSNQPLSKYCPYKTSDEQYNRRLHITCAVYNYNGTEILASYNDDDVFLFDVDSSPGEFAHRYSGHRNGATIKGVSFFGPRSEFVMSGSDCAHIFFWEKKTESITQFLLADDNGVVNCLEPHPQFPFLATSGLDWDVKLWVPSCEEGPSLNELAATIRDNKVNGWSSHDSSSESQVLWMLWRRLRASRATREEIPPDPSADGGFAFLTIDSSEDSSSDSMSHTDDDDDGDDFNDFRRSGCATS